MNNPSNINLYDLLPTIYRRYDHIKGKPLQALFAIFEQELLAMRQEIAQSYDNCFIETCATWVIPYIADLLGVSNLHEQELLPNQRARVANAIRYNRRKGQKYTLEQLITHVTGWSSEIIEYKPFLSITQNMQIIRLQQGKLIDVRDKNKLMTLSTAFDKNAHTIDVHSAAGYSAKYNINNIGLFLWRLNSYPITGGFALQIADQPDCFTFNPVGLDMPLYTNPQISRREQTHIAQPISSTQLTQDLLEQQQNKTADTSAIYGPQGSFYIVIINNTNINSVTASLPVNLTNIVVMDLNDWHNKPTADQVAVDPVLGRLRLGENYLNGLIRVEVNYYYGFSANVGGGHYKRQLPLASKSNVAEVFISKKDNLQTAILEQNDICIIHITDDATYILDNLRIDNMKELIIVAADGCRPCIQINGSLQLAGGAGNNPILLQVTLNGLLINGNIEVSGKIQLNVQHCTLVPKPAIACVSATNINYTSQITIEDSISGSLYLPATLSSLVITRSIIDGMQSTAIAANFDASAPGPATALKECTVLGSIYISEIIEITSSIVMQPVNVDRTQNGCVQYSYLPLSSRTPPRYRCQPDLIFNDLTQRRAAQLHLINNPNLAVNDENWYESTLITLQPKFVSTRYGDPNYAQLALQTSSGIRNGAKHGSEMGVFCNLQQFLRNNNLDEIINSYLPYGLTCQKFFMT